MQSRGKQNEESPRSFLVLSDRSRGWPSNQAAADSSYSYALGLLPGAITAIANDNENIQDEFFVEKNFDLL